MKVQLYVVKFLMIFNIFNWFEPEIPTEDRALNSVIERTEKIVKKKYKLNLSVTGSSNDKNLKFKTITLGFQINRRMSIDESRCMLIELADIFLTQINDYEEIRPYLTVFPYTYDNIDITLYISHPDYSSIYHPDIAVASIEPGGEFVYLTDDPNQRYKFKSKITETYHEALEKVKNCKPRK